jgi:hypothetical protein
MVLNINNPEVVNYECLELNLGVGNPPDCDKYLVQVTVNGTNSPNSWYLQFGSYDTESKAEKMINRLKKLNINELLKLYDNFIY